VSAPDFHQRVPGPVSRNKCVNNLTKSNVDIKEEEEPDTVGNSPLAFEQSPLATRPNTSELQRIEIVPIAQTYSNQVSNISSESDYRANGPIPNLNKLQCTGKIVYEDGVIDIDTPYCANDKVAWSDGLYLSANVEGNEIKNEAILSKLQRKKQEKIKGREDYTKFIEDWHSRKLSSNFTSVPTDFDDPSDIHVQYRFLDSVPTFEEFLLILDEDQKYDPRFKRQKQISRKIAQRYNIAKDRIQGGPSEPEPKTEKKSRIVAKLPPITEKTKKVSKVNPTARDQIKEPKPKLQVIRSANLDIPTTVEEYTDTNRMAKEVGGVTVSQPCEKHVLDHAGKRRYSRRDSRRISTSKNVTSMDKKSNKIYTPSIYLNSPTGANFVLHHAPPPSPPPSLSKDDVPKSRSSSMKTHRSSERRTTLRPRQSEDKSYISKEMEYQEMSSESEEACSDSADVFDARKLNTKYSFERLRGKNYHKKKPAFYDVLKKYYKAQKIVDAFQVTRADGTKKKKKSVFHRLLHPEESDDLNETEKIGKMKRYNFLLHRRRTRVKVDPHTFEVYSMHNFKDNVLKALDDFVVRREYVISDIGAKCSTTVTFTRKLAFSHRK